MKQNPSLEADLRRAAHACADAARVETLRYFRASGLAADDKGAGVAFDPVPEGDRAAARAMRAVLANLRPDDAILGEEEAATSGTSGLPWVLDPIDGTRGYISGTPTWGVLICVSNDAGPLYGIIDQPYIGERFEGGFGHARVAGPRGDAPRPAAAGGRRPRRAGSSPQDAPPAGARTTRPWRAAAPGPSPTRPAARSCRCGADRYAARASCKAPVRGARGR